MKPSQEAAELYKKLKHYGASLDEILLRAEYVYAMCTEGYDSEVPSKEGAMLINQKAPAVAIQALQVKQKVYDTVVKLMEENQTQDINLVINVAPLEDTRGQMPEGL